MLEDGTIFDGDVRNTDLEKALPIIKETGVTRAFSMVRGHFKSQDGQWLHIDTGCGNHFFLRESIGKEFFKRFVGQDTYLIYLRGVEVVQEILKEMK
jgi:hypothetical protein